MSAKSIVWVHPFGPTIASYRYRASIPCEEVGKINGYTTAMQDGEADIVVFSKPSGEQIPIAEKAKADGAKIIVDFADDHFHHPVVGPIYHRFAELSDGIVTGSTVMRGRIYDYIKKDSVVIGDPYEQEECAPHANGEDFLWFGHIRNFGEAQGIFPYMGKRRLRVVTGPQKLSGTIQWTPHAMPKVFAVSNIVILPTQEGAEYKSPNRLLNSIRAGCFAVCMKHPAYQEFRDFVWVGDFVTGLRWVDVFKEDLNALVAKAQGYIRDRYSPAAIGKQWADYLESV